MPLQSSGNVAVTGLLYLMVAVACAGLSSWSTFHGLAQLQVGIAGLIAAIIFLALFLCHYVILRRRQAGAALIRAPYGLVGPLVLLILVTVLSASSSFAYFYYLAMREPLAISRSVDAGTTFETNFNQALTTLSKADRVDVVEQKLKREFQNLEVEVFGANRPGFADLARKHVTEIARIMAQDAERAIVVPTLPAAPGTERLNRETMTRLQASVDAQMGLWRDTDPIRQGIGIVTKAHANARESVTAMRAAQGAMTFEERRVAIARIEQITADIEVATNDAFLKSSIEPKPTPLRLTAVDDEGLGLTNITEVYQSVFVRREAPGIAAMSIFIAILLDILPFLIALILFRPSEDPREGLRERGRPERPARAHAAKGGAPTSSHF